MTSSEDHNEGSPVLTKSHTPGFGDYISILQDGFFNHGLRLLGQERMLRYLGVYPHDAMPKTLLAMRTNLADETPPIHRIPVEILGEIFTHYTHSVRPWENPVPQLSVGLSYDETPFVLGQVCGLWRHIVVAMPTLWQCLCVYNPTERCIPLVNLWLQRAGGRPLTIHLTDMKEDLATINATHTILVLLIGYVRQWKHIDFCIPKVHQHILATLPMNETVLLQHAEVDTASWDFHNGDSMWRALHSSPVLAHAKWDGFYSDIDRMPNHVPWPQLTHIALSNEPNASSVLRILQACENVTILTLWGLKSATASPHQYLLSLPKLHTLDICAFDDPGPFLRNLLLPNLSSLSIHHWFTELGTSPSRLSQPFRDFLEQSSSSLKTFKFRDESIDENDLARCLTARSLISLSHLEIHARLTDLTITSLTNTAERHGLLPNLTKICLLECRTTPGAFLDMITPRLSSLHVIHVGFCPKHGDYTQEESSIRAIKRLGLDVAIL